MQNSKFMSNHTEIRLTESHQNQIKELGLAIHINNAINSIDGLVNSANVETRLQLDEAVNCYCKNQLNSYKNWLSAVEEFAIKHKASTASAISILDDINTLKEFYWPTGVTSNYINKYSTDN